MKNWKKTFTFKGKEIYYNQIKFNNPTERAVEIPIAFDFLANIKKPAKILEVGNSLSYYENALSETLGIRERRIVDKFESELGVDNEDLMNIPSEEKYDAILSISTIEHIGQNTDPSGGYGEQLIERDLEAPLKAIAKIYDLLAPDGKAMITVPFGKLTDGEWYIQFSKEYLYLLSKKYGIPKEAISINCLKLIDRESTGNRFNVCWEELDALELSYVEYGSPFSQANAIAVVELSKLSMEFNLKLNVEPTHLLYNIQHEYRAEFEKNKLLLEQTQSELKQAQAELEEKQFALQEIKFELEYSKTIICENQNKLENLENLKNEEEQQVQIELEESQAKLQQTQDELEQYQFQLNQTQSELEQSQSQLHQTQSELEQSQSQLHQTRSELEQSQLQLHQTQSELEQSQLQLHQTQSELEQSQLQLHQTQSELEQSQLQLHQTQSELEQSQLQLHQTQSELEQSQLQLHQTQSELEQSQLQLHQTQSELEHSQKELQQSQKELHQIREDFQQSQKELHQIREDFQQSQKELHQIREDFQQSQSQLDQIKGELKRSRSSQTTASQTDRQSQQTHYDLLVWEAWYACQKGDLKEMDQYLRQSLKHTPLSRTQTILNWLENFARFNLEKGENFDANFLTNTPEWKELMRGILAVKAVSSTH